MRLLIEDIKNKIDSGKEINSNEICSDWNIDKSYLKDLLDEIESDPFYLQAVDFCNVNNHKNLDLVQIGSHFKIGSNRALRIFQFLNKYYFTKVSAPQHLDEFKYLDELYENEDFDEFISEFELKKTILNRNVNYVNKYIYALYRSVDMENEAIEIAKDYLLLFPDDEIINLYLGHLYYHLGNLNKSYEHYLKSNDNEFIIKTKKKINDQIDFEVTLQENKHSFKSSRGILFCKYCGNDNTHSREMCSGKKYNHNFILIKNKADEWIPTCNKCGNDKYSGRNGCS